MRSLKETYVYMILESPLPQQGADSLELVKIGMSIDVKQRRTSLQRCTPRKLDILKSFGPYQHGKARKLEKDMHNLCAEFSVGGEWFTREAEKVVNEAMNEDTIMTVFEKQELQTELALALAGAWVLSTIDLTVTDQHGRDHVLDLALHTGEFVFGRITVGSLCNVALPGMEEIQCKHRDEIPRIVEWATAKQETHCKSRVLGNASHQVGAMA